MQNSTKICTVCKGLNSQSSDQTNDTLELGDMLYKQGHYLKALEIYEKVASAHNQDENSCMPQIYYKLGQASLKQWNCENALIYFSKALEIEDSFEQKNFENIASILLGIGETYTEDAKYPEAQANFEKARDILVKSFGEDHPKMAVYYNYVGDLNDHLGKYQEGIECLEKAIKILLANGGQDKRELATSYCLMGSVYNSLKNNEKILEYVQKSLELRNEIYGERHPEIAECYNFFGMVYQRKFMFQQALHAHKLSLEMFQEFLGKSHPKIATSYNNTGIVYSSLGNKKQALESYNNGINVYIAYGKENHPKACTLYSNAASTYCGKAQFNTALTYYKSLAIRIQACGEFHPRLVHLYQSISDIQSYQGEIKAAEESLLKALTVNQKFFGEESSQTARSYIRIGDFYLGQNEFQKVLKNYRKALKICSCLRDDKQTASCFSKLSSVFSKVHDSVAYRSCVTKEKEIYKKVFERHNLRILTVIRELVKIEKSQEQLSRKLMEQDL